MSDAMHSHVQVLVNKEIAMTYLSCIINWGGKSRAWVNSVSGCSHCMLTPAPLKCSNPSFSKLDEDGASQQGVPFGR
jgi:hypothetical protein